MAAGNSLSSTDSAALWQRAQAVLAAGPATFSKHPDRFAPGVTPCALVHGEGCYVTDVDGHTYLDTIGALGAVLLGYSNPTVDEAVKWQVEQGAAFSLMHPLEVEVAERLVRHIPCAEQVRFCLNGTDATNAAIRLARASTGKPHVFFVGYHGFHDSYVATTSMHAGTLPVLKEYNHQFRWGDWETLGAELAAYHDQGRGGVACILAEVPPRPWREAWSVVQGDLVTLKTLCQQYDTLFILDEIVTGFRYDLGGAQAMYDVIPDLACVGKALANGYPLAALVGQREYMSQIAERGVFISSTHGGNAIGLAAAKATLLELEHTPALGALWQAGARIGGGLQALFQHYTLPVTLLGTPARMIIQWHGAGDVSAQALKTLWLQETVTQGVLFGGPLFPTAAMDQVAVRRILHVAEVACEHMARALEGGLVGQQLKCGAIESDVFAQRYRA